VVKTVPTSKVSAVIRGHIPIFFCS